jgi:hypothetical protein
MEADNPILDEALRHQLCHRGSTGIILEFEFGTNWSNYSWFVGDIFGAPLAIEGILAFFMEATFIAIMFFGWNKVSKGVHLMATWLTVIGATLSALWILVANAWMQFPDGMTFNPDTMRNEMADFWAVLLSRWPSTNSCIRSFPAGSLAAPSVWESALGSFLKSVNTAWPPKASSSPLFLVSQGPS